MDTTVVMQTTNQLMSNPVTMVNEMPLDSLFIDMGQSIPEFTEDFDVQPDQVLLPNWDPQNAPNFYIVPSEFITTTTAAPTTTTTTAFPVTIPTQTISIPVSFSTVNQTQPLQYQVQQQPQQQQQPLQYQTQQILVPIVYENVNTAVYAQQPHQFHHAAVAVVPSPTYSSPASVVAVAANSPPTMQISYSSSPVSSNNNNKKRRTSNDDSDYDSDAQLSDYDSDLHIGSSPQHHSSGDSGPVKKITKHKRRRSKDAKIKVERNRGACEKHKRDRKRCPLDCPMRTDSPTKRQAKGSATAGSEVAGKSPLVAPQSTSPSMPAVQSEAASMIQQSTFIIEQQQPIQSQQNQLVA